MSKKYCEDIKIIKKPFSLLKRIVALILIVVSIFGVYVLADYFSGALTLSTFGFSIGGGEKITREKFSYYAVVMGTFDTYTEAERVGLGLQVQGAAGYVLNSANKYIVVGSIYKSQEDAKNVIDNLKDSKYDMSIFEIKFNKLTMHIKGINTKDKKMIVEAMDFIDKLYSDIYSYSINYDSSSITNLQISSYLNTLLSSTKVYISAMQEISTRIDSKYISSIRDSLILLETSLDTAVYRTLTDSGINYYLKYLLCEVVKVSSDLNVELFKIS